jgi:hypothetical protein
MNYKLQIYAAVLLLFLSCEKASNYRFSGIPIDDGGGEVLPPPIAGGYPADSSLAFHEDFQTWKREGFDNLATGNCDDDLMTTATVMYVPLKPHVSDYGDFSVSYTLKDFAANPACAGGYVALQQLIFYECGQHDSDAQMILSALPSVSQIRFAAARYGKTEDVAGISLWKKSEGETAFTKVGDYLPTATDTFTVEINEQNVQLKFIPALTGRENPVNDGINRSVRIYDLWVYSMKL